MPPTPPPKGKNKAHHEPILHPTYSLILGLNQPSRAVLYFVVLLKWR